MLIDYFCFVRFKTRNMLGDFPVVILPGLSECRTAINTTLLCNFLVGVAFSARGVAHSVWDFAKKVPSQRLQMAVAGRM